MHVARRRECQARLDVALAKKHGVSYVAVQVEQMVGVLLLVYVRPGLAPSASHLYKATVKTGLEVANTGLKAGNKGGVAVRMRLGDAELCFVNSHLAAGSKHAEERNQDHADVLKGLAAAFGSAESRRTGGPYPPPLEHDLCVWLGDLNYRVELPNDEVRVKVAEGRWSSLLPHDQLTKQQGLGLTFVGFDEAPLAFPPTYKYDAGTNTYDSSEKQRVPSWTDRVLWRGATSGHSGVTALAYVACQAVLCSDHKPVAALLR